MKDIAVIRQFDPFPFPHWIRSTIPHPYSPFTHSFIYLFLETDVIQDQSNPCKFFFYEVYIDIDAVLFHKEQTHFALWTDFKASGGVVANTSHKCDGIFMSE
jgi:hypothetical protein